VGAEEGKEMKTTIAALTAAAGLSGCFFFYIPGGAIEALTGNSGNGCVAETAKAGDLIKFPNGNIYKVSSLTGHSSRCQDPSLPVLATLIEKP
jgi:hypothetical protein